MTRGRRAAPSPSAPPSMHGYSDRINHAFAFAAKYYGAAAPVGVGMDYLAHPANVAVILEPKYDRRGMERPWQPSKQEYLSQLAAAEPRALDICVADELHTCGSTITGLRRLGVEYLRTLSRAGSEQTIWWYRSMLEVLDSRSDWPRREMLSELRLMSTDLVRGLRLSEEEL